MAHALPIYTSTSRLLCLGDFNYVTPTLMLPLDLEWWKNKYI